jgi:hypothetical protein
MSFLQGLQICNIIGSESRLCMSMCLSVFIYVHGTRKLFMLYAVYISGCIKDTYENIHTCINLHPYIIAHIHKPKLSYI